VYYQFLVNKSFQLRDLFYILHVIHCIFPFLQKNSSADEIANVNFLRRHCTRTTAHNKVHFAYGKHTCPQVPNETLTIIDSRIGLNSATAGSSQDMSQCCYR